MYKYNIMKQPKKHRAILITMFFLLSMTLIGFAGAANANSVPGMFEVSVGSDGTGNVLGDYPTLEQALSEIYTQPTRAYTITAGTDETITDTMSINPGYHITLMSNSSGPYTITQAGSLNRHFTVNGSLTLDNIVLDGGNSGGGVQVDTNASFTMNSGSMVQNCYTANFGGGVYMDNGAVFTMPGGTITNNTANKNGGGVYISGGTFTMSGDASISHNTANAASIAGVSSNSIEGGGGGVYAASGSFSMTGGNISYNESKFYGGGIFTNESIEISNGVIVGNKAATFWSNGGGYGGGIFSNGAALIITDAQIGGNTAGYGGGICLDKPGASLMLKGGSVVQNNFSIWEGGGIHEAADAGNVTIGDYTSSAQPSIIANNSGTSLARSASANNDTIGDSASSIPRSIGGGIAFLNPNSTLDIQGGTISNNRSCNGNGVFSAGTTTMSDGVLINSNTSITFGGNCCGGGVYIYGNGTFTMAGGEISSNNNIGDTYSRYLFTYDGGGVYVGNGATFTMSGGTITGNTADLNGGGVYVAEAGTFNVTGQVQINNNTASQGDGGGIYTEDATYQNLTIPATTIFSGNTAQAWHIFTGEPYDNIQAASESISFNSATYPDYPLNNYDINYTSSTVQQSAPPTIDPVMTGDANITGTGVSGAKVLVSFPDGSVSNAIYVDNDNIWSVPAPNNLIAGQQISAIQTEPGKDPSNKVTRTVNGAPNPPTINQPYTGAATISGTGTSGYHVTVLLPDGRTTASTLVGEDGKWTANNVPAGITLKSGDKISAIQIDASGNASNPASAVVANIYSGGGGGGGSSNYTVTFATNGGSTVSSQRISYNGKATKPADPTKDGFTFAGWYSDKELTQTYDFSKAITGNTTLYARWTENTVAPKPAPEPAPSPTPTLTPGQSSIAWQNPFSDVKSTDWFYSDVEYAAVHGLFNGTSATTFSPNGSVTRAMFVTALWRLAGNPVSNAGNQFTDVNQGAYYAEAIKWAAANSIVKGISNNQFAPNKAVTREQMAAILYRYEQFSGQAPSVAGPAKDFADRSRISDYAKDPVTALVRQGILSGKPNNLFDPQGTAMRAEVAAMLHRYMAAVQ